MGMVRICRRVQQEGIRLLLLLVETIGPMSVRQRSQSLRSEVPCRDLQDVACQMAVKLRLPPKEEAAEYQTIGDKREIGNNVATQALVDGIK